MRSPPKARLWRLACARNRIPRDEFSVGYGGGVRIPQVLIVWDMTVLTTTHERVLTLLFLELERNASERFEVLLVGFATIDRKACFTLKPA
jgi:hypothetical protein